MLFPKQARRIVVAEAGVASYCDRSRNSLARLIPHPNAEGARACELKQVGF